MKHNYIFNTLPLSFNIDICGICNLQCSYCPEGQRLNFQTQKFMSLQNFTQIINALPGKLTNIGLTNWSEPFLNQEIVKIIESVKKSRPEVKIWVSSNGNAFKQNLPNRIVRSGLDYLEITISGLSDDIYQKYHKSGRIDRVYKAIDMLTRAKIVNKATKPHLTINYLQFPYNVVKKNVIKQTICQKLANGEQEKQIDEIRIVRGTMLGSKAVLFKLENRFLNTKKMFKHITHYKNLCLQLFLNPSVRADGSVFPCCISEYRDQLIMGNLLEDNFLEIWESEKYKKFRTDFLTNENEICNACFLKYSLLPFFETNHFKLNMVANLKLFIQLILKRVFIIDKIIFNNLFFQFWLKMRLKRKLRPS